MTAIETAIRVLIGLLIRGEYATLERVTRSRRLSASELQQAIAVYGRTLIEPGPGWWEGVTVTPIQTGGGAAFHVAAPLWTLEEGRSDLTLEVRLFESAPEAYESDVMDLHVM